MVFTRKNGGNFRGYVSLQEGKKSKIHMTMDDTLPAMNPWHGCHVSKVLADGCESKRIYGILRRFFLGKRADDQNCFNICVLTKRKVNKHDTVDGRNPAPLGMIWDVWNPVNHGIFTAISTGAGFLFSKVWFFWRLISLDFGNPQNLRSHIRFGTTTRKHVTCHTNWRWKGWHFEWICNTYIPQAYSP